MSEQQQVQFGIEKIYLKDLSLEIPNAPQIFLERENPQIEISVHNAASPLEQGGLFEVVMTVTVTAKLGEKTVFLIEVAQAGIFQIVGLPTPEIDAVLGIMCPNTLLPYAREAVASLMARAGMNFEAAYQERLRQLQQEQAAQAAAPKSAPN